MNVLVFDLNLLKVLDALLATGSVSAAATRVGLSQPAASACLRRLRLALADPLLIREGNRMRLSPRAERLRSRVQGLLAEIGDTLNGEAFEPDVTERDFRIAASDDAIYIIVTPLIAAVRTVGRNLRFDVVSVSENVAKDLKAGQIDLAISPDWCLRRVSNRKPILMDGYVTVSREPKRWTLSDYATAEHVLVAPHGRKTGIVDAVLDTKGLSRNVAVTVPDFASACRLVRDGDLIATMPRRIGSHYAALYKLALSNPPVSLPSLSLSLGWRDHAASNPALQWLIEQILVLADTGNQARGGF